jgi:3-oxoacyl-[acyl-carrier-protein] synthase-1
MSTTPPGVPPTAVLGAGLVCGLGLTAAESCAAIRCGINDFQETRFIAQGGGWIVGSAVTLEEPWRGVPKLARMAARAIAECLAAAAPAAPDRVPVLLAVAEPERPGRAEDLDRLPFELIEEALGHRLHPHSRVVPQGRVGGAVALHGARRALAEGRYAQVVLAGVDSFLDGPALAAYEAADRLLTRANSNGFLPGEAAAAVLLGRHAEGGTAPLLLRGLGFATEPAPLGSGKPLRAEGLVQAIRAALAEAGVTLDACDARLSEANGEQYRFREASLASSRLLRDRGPPQRLRHLADSIGEVGAATLPAMLAHLLAGAAGDYLDGTLTLVHLGNDGPQRAALVAQAMQPQALSLEAAADYALDRRRRAAAV